MAVVRDREGRYWRVPDSARFNTPGGGSITARDAQKRGVNVGRKEIPANSPEMVRAPGSSPVSGEFVPKDAGTPAPSQRGGLDAVARGALKTEAAAPAKPAKPAKPAAPKPAAKKATKTTPAKPSAATGPAASPAVASPSATSEPTPAPSPEALAEAEDYIRRNYGYLAWVLDHPELGDVFRKAVAEGWESERVQGAVRSTAWYQETAKPRRDWLKLRNEDPATAEAMVGELTLDLKLLSAQLGITVDGKRLREIAEKSLEYGWVAQGSAGGGTESILSNAQARAALIAEADYRPDPVSVRVIETADPASESGKAHYLEVVRPDGQILHPITGEGQLDFATQRYGAPVAVPGVEGMTVGASVVDLYGGPNQGELVMQGLRPDPLGGQQGDLGARMAALKAKAAEYLMPISDETAHNWALRILEDQATDAGFEQWMRTLARGRFPDLAPQIEQGDRPADLLAVHRERIATLLEIPVAQVDLVNDARFSKVVQHVPPGSKPEDPRSRRSMTLAELDDYVTSLPEYETTRGAQVRAATIAEQLGRTFGRV